MALAEGISLRDGTAKYDSDVVLGDDFVAPESTVEKEMRSRRESRSFFSLKQSPLTRKIIMFNLIALLILVTGVMMLSSSSNSLSVERANALASQAKLVATVMETRLDGQSDPFEGIDLRSGVTGYVFDDSASLIGEAAGAQPVAGGNARTITNGVNWLWSKLSGPFEPDTSTLPSIEERVTALAGKAVSGQGQIETIQGPDGNAIVVVVTPIDAEGALIGAVALASAAGEVDALVQAERESVLRMFVIAALVSIGLSLVLASTIANPLSDLASAAEIGRARDKKQKAGGRIRIPDLTARPDEIGRLSGALRGMVSALYDRIDGNEQFAADVAHEIKNPLASLRSAVGTLRVAKRDDQRDKLLDVIDHDVRRLDRLVSDISNASRLDSELVKEEQESFELMKMLTNLSEYLGQQAGEKGVDFITDLPDQPVNIMGLEARLAQVFVNLITNATSFCEDGDAIRVWARQKENRVLIVVEDTGPGIPEEALTKVFKRFYSERPETQFGNNSGLGLAISKQIVEAHGGVIWAENIRPTDADPTSEPLGARFVVGLPV